jgi:hypothetical protein
LYLTKDACWRRDVCGAMADIGWYIIGVRKKYFPEER